MQKAALFCTSAGSSSGGHHQTTREAEPGKDEKTMNEREMKENKMGVLPVGRLLLSMSVGVLLAIFQAVTQIHEQTLSFIFKLTVVVLVLLIGGGWMMETLLDYARRIFDLMVS